MAQINIKGSNAIDEKIRLDALNTINGLPTDLLEKLGKLAKSKTAQNKLKNQWLIIKSMVGA